MYECFTCTYMCTTHLCLSPQRPEKCVRYPSTGVATSCDLPCGCWELNPSPLQERQCSSLPSCLSDPDKHTIKKKKKQLGVVAFACSSIRQGWKAKTGDFLGLLAILAYLMSSRPLRDSVSNKQKKKTRGGQHLRYNTRD